MDSLSSRRFAYGLAIFVAAYAAASLLLPHRALLVGLGNAGGLLDRLSGGLCGIRHPADVFGYFAMVLAA